jgi:FAD/FMN-containing dehydrogenase
MRSENLAAVARGRPLTRGLGRSYGDASLPPAGTLEVAGSALADRLLAFDSETGVLRAEAGLALREILRLFLPRGFWPPASPGTAFVTLGGMVAADVHGKSHHRDGSFGKHVRALRMLLADGSIDCMRSSGLATLVYYHRPSESSSPCSALRWPDEPPAALRAAAATGNRGRPARLGRGTRRSLGGRRRASPAHARVAVAGSSLRVRIFNDLVTAPSRRNGLRDGSSTH